MKPDELQFSGAQLSKVQKLFVIVCSSGEKTLKIGSVILGVASSSPPIGILTLKFSSGTRSSCVQ